MTSTLPRGSARLRSSIAFMLVALLASLGGCGDDSALPKDRAEPPPPPSLATAPRWVYGKIETPALPDLPPGRPLEPGITLHEASITMAGGPIKLWIYLPDGAKPKSLPCVFIAPSGTTMLTGATLGEGSRAEHLPYVKAGFAVVAYELQGPVAAGAAMNSPEFQAASAKFREAWGGLKDAKAAIEFAIAKIPAVDPSRLFAAGHSSAAVVSFLVAAYDARLRGALAYMPAASVGRFNGNENMLSLEATMPGIQDFALRCSPEALVSQMRVPIFMFGVGDDERVPFSELANVARALMFTQKAVEFSKIRSGGHAKPLATDAIPRGIEWIKARCAQP